MFQAQTKFGFSEGTKLIFILDHNFAGKEHNLGRFRISVTDSRPPILLQGATPENIVKMMNTPPEKRTPLEKANLASYYRGIDPELARLQRFAAEIVLPSGQRALGAQDLAWALDQQPGVPVQQVIADHDLWAHEVLQRSWLLRAFSGGKPWTLRTAMSSHGSTISALGLRCTFATTRCEIWKH